MPWCAALEPPAVEGVGGELEPLVTTTMTTIRTASASDQHEQPPLAVATALRALLRAPHPRVGARVGGTLPVGGRAEACRRPRRPRARNRWPARRGSTKNGARSCSMRSMFSGVSGSISPGSSSSAKGSSGGGGSSSSAEPSGSSSAGEPVGLAAQRVRRRERVALVLVAVVVGLDARVDLGVAPGHRLVVVEPLFAVARRETRRHRTAGRPRRPLSDPRTQVRDT